MKNKLLVPLFLMLLFTLGVSYASSISVDLYVGETYAFQPRVIGDDGFDVDESITWYSSDTDVASVKDGIITALSKGQAVITASVSEGSSLRSFSVYLTVQSTVKSIELIPEKNEIYVGEEISAEYSITPYSGIPVPVYDKVTFESTDESVFTVDKNGTVKGIGSGSAFLKVISDDGERTSMKKITVKNMVKSIRIDSDIEEVYVGEEGKLDVIFSPSDAYNQDLEWSASSQIDIDDDGSFTAEAGGTAYVTAIAEDGDAKATYKFLVKSMVSGIEITSKPIELDDTRTEYQLTAELEEKYPGKTPIEDGIEWESNRSSIASVSKNGLVTAKGTGYAIITATSKDGEYSDSITLHIKLGEKSDIEAESIAFTSSISNARVGEACNFTYELLPADTTEDSLELTYYGGDGEVIDNDGYFTFIPYDQGRYTLIMETENELKDYTYLDVSSNISGIEIDSNGLIRNVDTGRYTIYLGQTGTLDYDLIKKSSAKSVLLKDAEWSSGDTDIITIDSDGEYFAKEIGDTYIQIEALDNNVTEMFHVEVVGMSESAELPSYAEIGLKTAFKPVPFFTLEEDLLYGYTTVLDNSYELEIEHLYLPESFLKNERDFEKERQKKLEDWIEAGTGDLESLEDELESSKDRYTMIRMFLSNSKEDYAEVNYDNYNMTDRSFDTLDIAEIKNEAFYASVVCKAELALITADGEHEDSMVVFADGELADFFVYDLNGALLNYDTILEDYELEAETAKAKAAAFESIENEAAEKTETLKAKYASLPENSRPSDETLLALESAKGLNMLLPGFESNYKRAVTRLEMAKICFGINNHFTGESAVSYPYEVFSDTADSYATWAYYYGLVPFSENGTFSPNEALTREEMTYMLYKTLKGLDKSVNSAISPPKSGLFEDQDSISDAYAPAVGQLAYRCTIVTGLSDTQFAPLEPATIDYTLKYATDLVKSLE